MPHTSESTPAVGDAAPPLDGRTGHCCVTECLRGINYTSVKPFLNAAKAKEATALLTRACSLGFKSLFNAEAAAYTATGTRWKCTRIAPP